MKKEQNNHLKQQIIDTAWNLFYKKGYENTTLNDIIEETGTSKGGFYYYFNSKDELLNSLFEIFDREYEKFYSQMDKSLNSLIQLKLVNQYIFYFIEGNVSVELLSELYKSQLTNKTQENFLSSDRYFTQMIRRIISEGQKKGEIRQDIPFDQLAHHVMLLERGILMDWCTQNGGFSVGYFGAQNFDYYIEFLKPRTSK
jgi:AcrR family transcriptional regulator